MKYILSAMLLSVGSLLYSQEWQQIGNFNRAPISLFTDTIDNLLYIGGEFRFNGSDTVNGVCNWNGLTINKMGAGQYDACGSNTCQSAAMFIRYKNDIYTGGYFDEIAGVASRGIARWNGTTWLPVSPGLYADNNGLGYAAGFCEHDGLLYVVGAFRRIGSDTANSVASWDGNVWQTYGAPEDIQQSIPLHYRVIFYQGQMYVAGNCYNVVDGHVNLDIMRYDGAAWRQVDNGIFGGLSGIWNMVVYHDELYVCGRFDVTDGNAGNMIMRWDGESWHDVGGSMAICGDATDMVVYQDKLYLVGIFSCVGDGLPVSSIAVWDGERWCSFGNSYFNNKIACIGVYNDEIYVGGGFTKVDGYPIKYFAKYTGDHSADVCGTVSTAAPQSVGQITIIPNPAYTNVRITGSPPGQPIESVQVFDAAGRDCRGLSNYLSGQQELDVQGLAAGLYFVSVQYGKRMAIGRFVKM